MSVCPYCRCELVSADAEGRCPNCRAPLSQHALDPAAWAAVGQAYEAEPEEEAPAVIRASLAAYALRLQRDAEPQPARALDGSPLAEATDHEAANPSATVMLPAGGLPLIDVPPMAEVPSIGEMPPAGEPLPPASLMQTFALDERDTDATGIFPSLVQVPSQPPGEIAKTQNFDDQITNSLTAMWHEKFDPAVTPRQTLKAPDPGSGTSSSKLVIKTRAFKADTAQPSSGPDYELLEVIGEGGMGVVYEARQTSIDRTVALKMLKGNAAADAGHREKFLSEAVVTGDLDHPNIVSVYDLGSNEAGALFYSMKRVQGTPWEKVLPAKSLPENIEILMKVADAIAFAHSRGLVHRDIKPENVMLGDFGEVLVMDWGLALPTSDFRKLSLLSPSSAMGGTPAYMAPEMATGPIDKIGPASDIYLLGSALYEVLTGKAPHTGRTVMECLLAAAQNKIQRTTQTGELLSIALRAMATDPAGRYQSVRDFQAAIRKYQSHSESIVLSNRAEQDLIEAEAKDDYQIFSRVIFAFEEAVALWSGNEQARIGLVRAKLAYGRRATAKGDLDLAASMVAEGEDAEYVALRVEIKRALKERDARQQRLRNAKRMAMAMALIVIAGGTFSFIRIRAEREQALVAEQQASDERDKALAAEHTALAAKQQASDDRDKAREAELLAREAQTLEKASAERALLAAAQAKRAEVQARNAKDAEEYEAYIARIGLAAARIEENAFDSAIQLLDQCDPKFRQWEWGRLVYLCDQKVRTFEVGKPVNSVAWMPDGKRFVSGSWDGKARVWDAETRRATLTIPTEANYVHAVAVSPDGKLIATGTSLKTGYLRLWDSQTGALLKTLTGHTDSVLSVTFSRDGRRLLTGSYDKTARLWDIGTGETIRTFAGHTWWVWSANFSSDERRMVTASQDGTAIVWDVASGQTKQRFAGHSGPVYTAAFSPGNDLVATGGYDKQICVFDPQHLPAVDYAKMMAGEQVEQPKFRVLAGHTAAVRCVQFSADGKLLLSGSHDNTLRLWNPVGGQMLKTLRGHGGWVRSCAFGPDGHEVLSGSHDNKAKIWNMEGYEEIRVARARSFEGHADAVLSASFSPDGREILTASRDRTARIWDLSLGRELRKFQEGHEYLASTAVFSADGKWVYTAGGDNLVNVWDVTAGTELRRFKRTGRNGALALSADDRWLLTGGDEKSATLWNTASGERACVLKPHMGEVTATAISPDAKILFTGDSIGHGMLWKADGTALKPLVGHTGPIVAAYFSPDGSRVLTASSDNTVAQWDVATGKELPERSLKHPNSVTSLACSGDGRLALTSCEDGVARLWDLTTAKLLSTLTSGDNATSSVAISRDGRLGAAASIKERSVRVWDLTTGRELRREGPGTAGAPLLPSEVGSVWSLVFSPAGESLMTVAGSGARLWSVVTGGELMTFTPNGAVASASFAPDGKRIVTASWDGSARVWDAVNGYALLKIRKAHEGYVNSAVFSPDGRKLLTSGDDALVKLWDAQNGKLLLTFTGHKSRVQAAVFSPDGKLVASGSDDKTARIWDARNGKSLHVLGGHQWAVTSVAFSRAATRLVSGSEDKTAAVWDVEQGVKLLSLEGHTASITSVAISPDGRRALSGSQDYTVKLWDISREPTGRQAALQAKEIMTLKAHSQQVTCVSFSPDGLSVLSGSRDGTAILWLAVDWKADRKARVSDVLPLVQSN
jgi:hypothetical protein